MRKINNYDKSREAFARAMKVIPSGIYGHQGPAEGCYIPVEAFPLYSSKAQGTYLWDLDGNRFIDYMCAYGPNILGYHDPDVDAAAARQRAISDCTTLPNTVMIDFADLLVDTVACADWAFFAKNGNDVTTLAVMASRAYTHRKKIVFFKGYYHGVAPWTQKIDYAGIIEEDVCNNIYVEWNNFEQLQEVFDTYKGEIAAEILYRIVREENEGEENGAMKFAFFSAKIPIAGEIPVENVGEHPVIRANVKIGSMEYRPQQNAFGENRTAELDFDYSVYLDVFCNAETEITTDMYSTEYDSDCEEEMLSYETALSAKSFNFSADGSAPREDADFDRIVMTTATASVEKTEKQGTCINKKRRK